MYDLFLQIAGNLAIHNDPSTGETRIYFVGHVSHPASYYLIYYVTESFGVWTLSSCSFYNTVDIGSQVQSYPTGNIAVDQSGTKIAYFGDYSFIFYHEKVGDNMYTFNTLSDPFHYTFPDGNSLQFTNNENLFYISRHDNYVYNYRWEALFCKNTKVTEYLI